MISNIGKEWITIKSADRSEIDVEKYVRNSSAFIQPPEGTVILAVVNETEVVSINKEDAIALANKILEICDEDK